MSAGMQSVRDVVPTRTEMYQRRAKIALAEESVDLLRSKRDALMGEYLERIHPFVRERQEFFRRLRTARAALALAEAECGPDVMRAAAFSARRDVETSIEVQNFWGVRFAEIDDLDLVRRPFKRGYSPLSTPARVDETAEAFEHLMTAILAMAEDQVKMTRLGAEIRRVSRRVNALEKVLLPRLKAEYAFIWQALEDRNRDETARLMMVKNRSEGAAEIM